MKAPDSNGRAAWSTRTRLRSWPDRARSDPRRDSSAAAWLGLALGLAFTTCFATGLYSHVAQHPPSWFTLPARPAGLYRITQGVHVATGIASVPLLLAKLWAVYPQVFRVPVVRGRRAAHTLAELIQRLSLVPLVAGSIFLLFSGVANIELWYPFPFFFPTAHYWVAWGTIGALVVHIGAKAPTVRHVLSRGEEQVGVDAPDRRRFLVAVGGLSALLTAVTVGQTVGPLRRLAILAARDPAVGTQGFPVNNTAEEAGIADLATDPMWRLEVHHGNTVVPFTREDLLLMPQREAVLPIACVEGWSVSKSWRGVPLRTVLDRAGVADAVEITLHSLEKGLFGRSTVNVVQTEDPDTLVALGVDGETLSLDHGFPARLIGPNRPGVMQTKWLSVIEVHA